jgi:hypothetical protein
MAKILQFKRSNDFYKDLAMQESSGKFGEINKQNYIGLYQMGEAALVDAGYYKEKPLKPGQKPGNQYNNDWKGEWKGKNGITSKEQFLSNQTVQEIAIREYHQIVWRYLKKHQQYEGQEIGGIILIKSGMIAAGHLVGHYGLKIFIDTNGEEDPKDGNGVPCSAYLKGFSGYVVDYSIDKLTEHLKESQMDEDNKSLEYSESDNETGGQFEGTLGANKVIDAKVSQLLSSPAQFKEYRQASLNEAMEELKLADAIIPGLSRQSLAFAKESQEFMQQFMGYPTMSSEGFTNFAGMNFGATPQNDFEEDPEFYANLGMTPDFNNLMNQHADLMGAINNSNPFGNSWQNEEQENCIIC